MVIFDHTHPKIIESTFSFLELVPAYKKSVYSICSFLRYSHFRVPWPDRQHQFLTMPTHKTFYHFWIFANLYQHAKIQFTPSVYSLDTVNFRYNHFWPSPPPKFSNIFKHAKICTSMQKIGYFHLFILDIKSLLESTDQIDYTHILILIYQKTFEQLLFFVNLYQYAKNEAVSSICSEEIVD